MGTTFCKQKRQLMLSGEFIKIHVKYFRHSKQMEVYFSLLNLLFKLPTRLVEELIFFCEIPRILLITGSPLFSPISWSKPTSLGLLTSSAKQETNRKINTLMDAVKISTKRGGGGQVLFTNWPWVHLHWWAVSSPGCSDIPPAPAPTPTSCCFLRAPPVTQTSQRAQPTPGEA